MANYKKFITLLLIFSVHMMPFNSAWASSSLGGWTITSQIAQGASTLYNATKSGIENGVNVVKNSTAKITPAASNVAKVLRGGAYGYAISVAVEQILGKAVDWVLDPANNQITYTVEDNPLNPNCSTRYWYASQPNYFYCSVQEAGNGYCAYEMTRTYNSCVVTSTTASSASYTYTLKSSPTTQRNSSVSINKTVVTTPVEEKKSIPLDTIAAQVISNAETHPEADKKAGAQTVTTATAEDMLANDAATQSDVETQLNANANTQTSEQATGNTKPNEANPEITDITLAFPAFCGWAPTVCQAANVVINFPITLTDWWNRSTTALTEAYTFAKTKVQEFSDIFKEEPQTDTELEFNDPTDDITDTSVSFVSSCPPPIVLADFNFHGIPIHWELDFTAWCDSLSTYLKPIVISMASFSAVLILGGVRENV